MNPAERARIETTIERLETLVQRALLHRQTSNAGISLRPQIVELDALWARLDPITRMRVERLLALIGFCSAQSSGVVGSGAPRFKQWTCAGSGDVSISGTGAPRFKQWTCAASGQLSVISSGAPQFKQWTCAASGQLSVIGSGAPQFKQWTCAALGQIAIVGSGAPLTKKWTCVASGQLVVIGAGAPSTKKWTCVASGTVSENPTSIFGANLVMWLRGDSLVDDGAGKASSWTDKGTFGNSPTDLLVAGHRPTINASDLGGKASATFGTGNRLVKTTGTNLALTNCSIFAVVKLTSSVGGFRCYAGMDTFAPEWGFNAGHPGFYAAGSQFPTTLTIGADTYVFVEVTSPGGVGGFVHAYLNGTENTPAPTNSGFLSVTPTSTTVSVGSGSNGSGDDLLGTISEIILVDRAATAPEAASVRAYVNAYYGTSF